MASASQLVGLKRKSGRSTVTAISRSRSGTPFTTRGSEAPTTTRPLYGSTPTVARVTTSPKANGPASAGTTIERPNGAPS